MSWTSFWTSFYPQTDKSDTQDLPLSARLTTLEGDMLTMRAAVDALHTSNRKLSGKVYRGVALGDTTEANPPAEGPELVPEHREPAGSKQSLYQRAAQLRRR